MRRVVITGMGVVSPLGCTLDSFWERATSGYSAPQRIDRFDISDYACQIAAQVLEFDVDSLIPKKEQRRMDRFCRYAVAAAKMAVTDSGLDMSKTDGERCGVILGSGVGGLETLEKQHTVVMERGPGRCSPFQIPMMIINIAPGLIAIGHGMKGPNYGVVSACASGAHAMGDAFHTILRGEADVMVSGGAEAPITTLSVGGFAAMRALSTRNDDPKHASRPFDKDRDGFVMGEGAGMLVLEELEHAKARGARIYGEMVGYGATCDAYHMTAPVETGEGAARAMTMALKTNGVSVEDVTYVNAHGTSTPLNDPIETRAIKRCLGEEQARKIMISSTKSMHGHLLGGAAALESVVCLMSISTGVIAPTINYTTPDPDCDLDYTPNEAREAKVGVCLNNSLGFGGHNACLAFRPI